MWATTVLMLAAVWALVAWALAREQVQTQREQASQVSLNAKGFSEYVGLHVLAIDRLLKSLRESYERTGTLPAHATLAADLGQLAPLLVQVAIADRSGQVVASSLELSPGVSIADRPHFRAFLADPGDRLHFSEPVTGRVSGKMSLQLVRPLPSPDGGFGGVIVASIDPMKLQQYFDSLDAFSADGSVLLAGRTDGIVRVRFTAGSITWGQSLASVPGWGDVASQVNGTHHIRSILDGRERIAGFHQVGAYPLVVAVTLPVNGLADLLGARTVLLLVLATAFTVTLLLLAARRARLEREREQLVARLRETSRREAEANQLKTHFLTSVSHDLRTPLNSILGFSELIREGAKDPGIVRFAGLIHESGKHLHELVDTLLDLAKIEAGRMDLQFERVDLRALLSTVAQVHMVSAEQKGIKLSLTMPHTPMELETDRTRLTQVLNNLVHNAVKFTSTGGVWISATDEGDCARIRVVDTGVGIPASKLPQVFDRFSMLAGEPGPEHGAGLGLALSRELVELLGGGISITSQTWVGTEVEIHLPWRRPRP